MSDLCLPVVDVQKGCQSKSLEECFGTLSTSVIDKLLKSRTCVSVDYRRALIVFEKGVLDFVMSL